MVHPLKRFTPLALIVFAGGCGEATIDSSANPAESSNDDVTYDPSTCGTDAGGMVYFALGREVYRRPSEDGMSIGGMSDEERSSLPQRPNPEEPEGCPDNPLWGRSFTINYAYTPANPAGSQQHPRMTEVTLIAISERMKNLPPEFEELKWGLQPSLETDFVRVREQYDSCEYLPTGLTACRVPDPGRDILNWTTKFQADPGIHNTPFGRPFTVSCSAWNAIDRQDCVVSYNYTEDTRISYEFELHEILPVEIIEFDKAIREKIESMRVFDYPWDRK